jgi:hypothetical protein
MQICMRRRRGICFASTRSRARGEKMHPRGCKSMRKMHLRRRAMPPHACDAMTRTFYSARFQITPLFIMHRGVKRQTGTRQARSERFDLLLRCPNVPPAVLLRAENSRPQRRHRVSSTSRGFFVRHGRLGFSRKCNYVLGNCPRRLRITFAIACDCR